MNARSIKLPKRIVLPENELREKYLIEKLSLRETAEHFGVTTPSVITNMKHYGIETRNLSESHKGKKSSPKTQFKKGQSAHNKLDLPIDEIVRLYVIENKSSVEIGEMYNCGHKVVLDRLLHAGIKPKGSSHFNFGKPVSTETKKKLSTAHKGKSQPQLRTIESRKKSAKGIKKAHEIKAFGWKKSTKRMRENGGTDAELYFEHLLKNHDIHSFEREYTVLTGTRSRYRIDFAFLNKMTGIELDGDSHKYRKEHDRKRDAILKSYGWTIVRFTNKELFFNPDGVVERIKKIIFS